MKKYGIYLSIILLVSCNEQAVPSNDLTISDTSSTSHRLKDTIPAQQVAVDDDAVTEFKTFIKYQLKDTIEEDFNGDLIKDKAFLKQSANQRHLYIVDGKTSQVTKVGGDTSFNDLGNNFDWVDFWGLTKDTATYEVEVIDGEVSGSRDVKLLYPSLVFRKEEVGGGVVTYRDKAYKWVHQAD